MSPRHFPSTVAIRRIRDRPHPMSLSRRGLTLIGSHSGAVPSPAWRAAFLGRRSSSPRTARPRLATSQSRDAVHFLTAPRHLGAGLAADHRWIAYAKSVSGGATSPSTAAGCLAGSAEVCQGD